MAACVACSKPLILHIEPEEDDEEFSMAASSTNAGKDVDDDVQLQCGCHFHWQCLLDAYSMSECPKCGVKIISTTTPGEQELLCTLKNEGGLQRNLDILPLLTEETYLKAYPEERKCRAFLEFCEEGDVEAIVDLLEDVDDDEEEGAGRNMDILRYQDPIESMNSGLHIAVLNERVNVAWLLLYLASTLPLDQFSQEALYATQKSLSLGRDDQTSKADIRSLKDAEGLTAEERAVTIGGVWNDWLSIGRLKSPAI
ncbi:hypothetical protein N7G274_007582 [Stereocaulon virgatum]|uniref:RING-type domain-containing protein n=1 Tax=Stereocaulon virgatum TaxID=373712 RepID=A0ABR4A3V1_9LECA